MAAIRSFNTKPEVTLRHALWRKGFRYTLNDKQLPGKPDIVLPKYSTVIFVHGCFWHGHNKCKEYTIPKTNTEYWINKVARNKQRDQETWRRLEARGWAVIIVWECQLKNKQLQDTVESVANNIRKNGEIHKISQAYRVKARAIYKQECNLRKERDKQLKEELKSRLRS